MRFQSIYDIAELFAKKGVSEVVLSPGSRCAPLTLAFGRHPAINTKTFSDERSAGFIALGMSQSLQKPVGVVCTSGTAVYNLAPSVAEAFFSHTPLIILTADRPAEWIAQHDGQTIYQSEIFGKHVKKFFQLPQEYEHPDDHWAINRIINDAINLAQQEPKGPVHINAPFREPLYPEKGELITYTESVRVIERSTGFFTVDDATLNTLAAKLRTHSKILFVAGQSYSDSHLPEAISAFATKLGIPVVSDIISNLNEVQDSIKHADLFLGQCTDKAKQELQPDLLLTIGSSLISKNTKLFLRKFKPKEHWHIQEAGVPTDAFKTLTYHIQAPPVLFLKDFERLISNRRSADYKNVWMRHEKSAFAIVEEFFQNRDASEFGLVKRLLENLPENCNLHLANSMSVRYANFVGLSTAKKSIRVFSNRGTSGIDGSNSTSVGHCLASGKPTYLITGDLAFFYDRNAFWHNYAMKDLNILLLNNHGGLIFNVIDGPASLAEAPEYFITRQRLNGKKLCEEFGFQYLAAGSKDGFDTLAAFLSGGGTTKILEFETDVESSKTIFNDLKQKIKKSYE
jgi:2-succinyl-5-enolpyruvyl-6-hydroxy-3-cyclohexene-1-carboxylate synthase